MVNKMVVQVFWVALLFLLLCNSMRLACVSATQVAYAT